METHVAMRRGFLLSAVCIVLALSPPARAAVLYNSDGFEQPTYSVGPLVGQDSWLGSGPDGNDPIVQSGVVLGGSQAAAGLRTGADLGTSIMAYRNFSPGSDLVRLQTAVRIEDMAGSGGYLDALTIYKDSFGGGGNRATILYFQDDGDVTVFDGGTERTISSWADDIWYQLDFLFDVPNQQFSLSINGSSVASGYAFLDAGTTAIAGIAYQEYGGLQGGGWYWDNLQIDNYTIPEPTSGLMMGMAALGLFLTRHRRRRMRG